MEKCFTTRRVLKVLLSQSLVIWAVWVLHHPAGTRPWIGNQGNGF